MFGGFGSASNDRHVPGAMTSLCLIGGVNCAPGLTPDLKVLGGAIIKKTLCVRGNTELKDTLIDGEATICGNALVKESLMVYEQTITNGLGVMQDAVISGNLEVVGKTVLGEVCITGNSLVSGDITFTGNVYGIDVSGGVESFSAGATGFTPSSPTMGDIVLGGTLNTSSGGTGLSTIGTTDQLLGVNGAGTGLEYKDDINLSGGATFGGNVTANNADITGKLTTNDLCVTNNADIDGSITVVGDGQFNSNVNVDGKLTTNDLCVTNNADVDGSITVMGDGQFNSNVNVDGKLTTNDLCVSNNGDIDGDLIVDGNTTTGNLDVLGKLTTEELCVNGNSQMIGDVTFFGNVYGLPMTSGVDNWSAGTTGFTPNTLTNGNVTLGGVLNTLNGGTGLSTIGTSDQILGVNMAGTGLEYKDDLNLSGGATFGGNVTAGNADVLGKLTTDELCVSGDADIDGGLNVDGNVTAGNADVLGKLTTDELCVNGDADIDGNLDVSGKLLTGELCVTGDSTFFGNVFVSGNLEAGVSSFSAGTTGFTPSSPTMGHVVLAGTLNTSNGGTGLSSIGSSDQILGVNMAGTGLEYKDDLDLTGGATFGGNVIAGNANVLGKLTATNVCVTNNVDVDGDLNVDGDTILGSLRVTTDGQFDNDANVDGKLTVNELCVTGNSLVSGDITFTGNVFGLPDATGGVDNWSAGTTGFTPSTLTNGNVVLGGTLNTSNGGTGLSSIGTSDQILGVNMAGTGLEYKDDLTLNGGATFGDDVVVDGNVTAGNADVLGKLTTGEMCVTGAGDISGNLDVDGKLTANMLCVTGDTTFFGNVTIAGNLEAGVSSFSAGTTGLTPSTPTAGDIVLAGTLNTSNGGTGLSSIGTSDQILGVNMAGTGLEYKDDLTLNGGATFGDDVVVDGNVTAGNADVLGKFTVNELCVTNNADIDGNLNVDGDLTVVNDTTLTSLRVTTDGQFDNDANVDGKLTVNELCVTGNSLVSGDITFTGNVFGLPDATGGVDNWSAGTTGFTPSTLTNGNVVLAGTLNTTNGGTGLSAIGTSDQILGVNMAGTGLEYKDDLTLTGGATFGDDVVVDGNLTAGNANVLGKLTTEDLCVNNNADINGNLDVSGKLNTEELCVFGNTTFFGNVTIAGNLEAGVSSFSAGTTGLTPNTPTAGDIVLGGVLETDNGGTGLSSIGSSDQILGVNMAGTGLEYKDDLTLTGGATFGGNVTVGNADVLGKLTATNICVTNDIDIDGDLNVDGDTILSNLRVTTDAQFDNDANVDGKLTVNELCVTGNSLVSGDITFTGNVFGLPDATGGVDNWSAGTTGFTPSTLTNGNVVLAGTLNTTNGGTGLSSIGTSDQILGVNMTGTGLEYKDDLTLTGGATFGDDVVVDGNLTAGNANVLGKLTTEDLCVNNNADINGNLDVSGKLNTEELCVFGNTTFFGNVTIAGNLEAGVSSFSAGTTGLTPSSPTMGHVVLAGTLNETNGGTGQDTYTTGDILYSSASNTLSKLTIGSPGEVLTVAGGVPSWAASPATTTLDSADGVSLVNDGTGPALVTKGLIEGTAITISGNGTAVTITNDSPASSVTLDTADGESLVNDGTGPALITKGLIEGSGITLSSNATSITIEATGGGGNSWVGTATSNLDMDCFEISNVGHLYVGNLHVKPYSSPGIQSYIPVWDNLNMEGSTCITFNFGETSTSGICIGGGAAGFTTAYGNFATSLGKNAKSANYCVAIGTGAYAFLGNSVAIGTSTKAYGLNSVAIGKNAQSPGVNAIAIGESAVASQNDEIVFGNSNTLTTAATATAWGQVFQNREWDDGNVGIAYIDITGNIIKGGSDLWVGNATSNLDMQCFDIGNVGHLYVGNIHGKSPVDVWDNFNMLDTAAGGKITFEAGIEIGDENTVVTSNSIISQNNGIAIGKSASVIFQAGNTSADGIAIGYNSIVRSLSGIAIGKEASAAGYSSISMGWRSTYKSVSDQIISIGAKSHTGVFVSGGTVSQSGGVITGVGTNFTPEMDRGYIVLNDDYNYRYIIDSIISATSLTVTYTTGPVLSNVSYKLYYDTYRSTAVGIGACSNSAASRNTAIGYAAMGFGLQAYGTCAIGYSAAGGQASADRSVSIGMTANYGEPLYSSGNSPIGVTISQSGTTITGVGTNFTPAMKGAIIQSETGRYIVKVASYVSPTQLIAEGFSQTVSAVRFNLFYNTDHTTAVGGNCMLDNAGSHNTGVGFESLNTVSIPTYFSGTAGTGGVSSTTVTGDSDVYWFPDFVNGTIEFTGGAVATIVSVDSSSQLTVTPAITVANGTSYVLYPCRASNTAIGTLSGNVITSGTDNTLLGHLSGKDIVFGTHNVCMGVNASAGNNTQGAISIGANSSSGNNFSVAIGHNITADQDGGLFVQHRGPSGYSVNLAGFIAGTNELVEITGGAGGNSWVGTATSNLDMDCFEISNVAAIHVGNIYGKSPVDVWDNFNMLDTAAGGKITFEGGIEIGDSTTSTTEPDEIAIGKNASVTKAGATFNGIAIGHDCSANSLAVAIGPNSSATPNSVAIGFLARTYADTTGGIAIGPNAVCTEDTCISIGLNAFSFNTQAITIGFATSTNGDNAISIGTNSGSSGDTAISIGRSSVTYSGNSIAMGTLASTYGNSSISIGYSANTTVFSSIAIGENASASSFPGFYGNCIAIGNGANTSATCVYGDSIAIGSGATSTGSGGENISIGNASQASGRKAIAIGSGAQTSQNGAIAIGQNSSASSGNSVVIGVNSSSNTTNSITIGENASTMSASSSNVGAIAIGTNSSSTNLHNISIGYNTSTTGYYSVTIGSGVTSTISNSVTLGTNGSQFLVLNNVSGTIQIGSLTSTVTQNGHNGQIILAAALGAGANATFTVNNNRVKSGSLIFLTPRGITSSGIPMISQVSSVSAGSFNITIYNPDPVNPTSNPTTPVIYYQMFYPT